MPPKNQTSSNQNNNQPPNPDVEVTSVPLNSSNTSSDAVAQSTVTKPPRNNGRNRKLIHGMLGGVLLLLVVVTAVAMQVKKPSIQPEITPIAHQTLIPSPTTATTLLPTGAIVPTPMPTWPPETRSYPSPTGDYTLVLTQTDVSTSCTAEVFDAQGDIVPMQFDFETLPCEWHLGLGSSSLWGWVNDTSVLVITELEYPHKMLTVYEVGTGQVSQTTYGQNERWFKGVNYSLSQWLYQSIHREGVNTSLYIVDADNNELREPLQFAPYVGPNIFYDSVNKGFLILSGQYVEPHDEYHFQWLDETTLEIHALGMLTWEGEVSPAAEWCSHSIDERKVSTKDSIPGTIIFSYDCDGLSDTHPFASELRFAVPQ